MDAGDIVNALSQASIKNASVSEVEFDNTISVVQRNDVPKISTLHSFEFIEKSFKVWCYYGIGAGVFHPFSSKWSFINNIKEKQPFIECLQRLKPISIEGESLCKNLKNPNFKLSQLSHS